MAYHLKSTTKAMSKLWYQAQIWSNITVEQINTPKGNQFHDKIVLTNSNLYHNFLAYGCTAIFKKPNDYIVNPNLQTSNHKWSPTQFDLSGKDENFTNAIKFNEHWA